jgi:hypothetical protein
MYYPLQSQHAKQLTVLGLVLCFDFKTFLVIMPCQLNWQGIVIHSGT